MKRKITIAVKNPGEPWEKRVVEDELPVYQQIVGGYIEGAYTTYYGVHVFCNEEGRLNNKKKNVVTPDGVIFGPVFAVRDNEEGEFESLTKEDLQELGITDEEDPDDPWKAQGSDSVAEMNDRLIAISKSIKAVGSMTGTGISYCIVIPGHGVREDSRLASYCIAPPSDKSDSMIVQELAGNVSCMIQGFIL